MCFLLSRLVGRDAVESLAGGNAVRRSEAWLERWGVQTVLLTRLLPFFSFDLVSYAAGLSRIRFAPFLLATVAGEVPAVAVYSWIRARAPEYIWLLVLINGVLLAAALVAGFFWNRRFSHR